MAGRNVILAQASAQRATAQQPQNATQPPATGRSSAASSSSSKGVLLYLPLVLVVGVVLVWLIWLWAEGHKVGTEAKATAGRLVLSVRNLLAVTLTAVVGIVLMKLALTRAEVDLKKSRSPVAKFLHDWVVVPIARVFQFV